MRGMNREFLGRMRERVTFEAFTGLDDGLGGVTRGWRRVANGWAAIEMVAVKEDTVAQQHARAIAYRLMARKPPGLNPGWRAAGTAGGGTDCAAPARRGRRACAGAAGRGLAGGGNSGGRAGEHAFLREVSGIRHAQDDGAAVFAPGH